MVWFALASTLVESVVIALTPGPISSILTSLDNPFGVEAVRPYVDASYYGVVLSWLILFAASALALASRWRRSLGAERQQLKWFVYAAVLLTLTTPAAGVGQVWVQLFFIAAILFLPIATGIAILRYRLWDIDLIIRRTLVYGVLTGLLGLVYLASVVLLQSVIRTLTGQTSQLAIVISTLGIAALFVPLRVRVQGTIDRRFYRRKYDAAKTLAEFSATARDEVELDQLTGRLVAAVEETMQPESVSLWLKRPESMHGSRNGAKPR